MFPCDWAGEYLPVTVQVKEVCVEELSIKTLQNGLSLFYIQYKKLEMPQQS